MCEKCDLKNYKRNIILDTLQNEVASYLTISYYIKENCWILSSFEDEIEIHYCPFCGRKLEEE